MLHTETYRDLGCYCITSHKCFPLMVMGDARCVAFSAIFKGDM